MELDYKGFLSRFHPISEADFELLFARQKIRHFKKGEFIVREGQVQRELFFVLEGVQMASFNNEGQEHVMLFSYPHSLTGIADSFLFQQPSEYNLKALTNTTLSGLSYERMNALFDQSQQLERLFRKMVEAQLCGLILRHREFHAYSIEERFKRFAERSSHLFQLVPHKYIANYLNISPTNFSKLYNSIAI